MSSSGFESPLLSPSDIATEMRSLNVNMSENDFIKPDPRRWMDIYSSIFNTLTTRSIEDAVQVFCHYGEEFVQHRDLFHEAVSQMGFTICMQRVLCSCGLPDFCVKDVIEPTRKRLIRIMSSVINKLRHDLARKDFIEATSVRCEQSKGEHERVVNANKELKHQWEMMMQNEEQREKQFSDCTDESEKLTSQIAEYQRQRDPELRAIEEVKLSFSEKTALKERLKIEKADVLQEHEKLSQKIVPSPDRFKQDQDRLKKRVIERKEVIELKLKKMTAEKSIMEQTAHNRNTSEKAIRLAKEVLSDLERANELVIEMENCNEKACELQEEATALYSEFEDVRENIAIRQGQKHTLSHQLDLKKQCGQQQKEDVKRNHEIYQEKLDRIKTQVEQTKRKLSETIQGVHLVDSQYEEMKRDWHNDLAEIYQEMDITHNKIANVCKEFNAIFDDDNK